MRGLRILICMVLGVLPAVLPAQEDGEDYVLEESTSAAADSAGLLEVPATFAPEEAEAWLEEVAADGSLTEADAAWLVRQPEFQDWIMQYPEVAAAIAPYPNAASFFYNRPYYYEWERRNRQQAERIRQSAMKWWHLSPEDRQAFYLRNPGVQSEPMKPEGIVKPALE